MVISITFHFWKACGELKRYNPKENAIAKVKNVCKFLNFLKR
jgi:hypothetical protein